jgi:capsular exopolysaccharide synthesis family protein
MSREGKSTLAAHLALSLSRLSSRPVLLIDADMRSPDQHHLFGVRLNAGLAEVLSKSVSLHDAIDRSLGDHLHILTAGSLRKNLYRNLSSESIEELFCEAKQLYEYIIIDTAPVLAASETLTIASVADGTLLSTMRDVSRHDHLKRCVSRLTMSRAKIVGTIFNGIPRWDYYYRYGNYRYLDSTDVEPFQSDVDRV